LLVSEPFPPGEARGCGVKAPVRKKLMPKPEKLLKIFCSKQGPRGEKRIATFLPNTV
jgi:hypothetical protein